MSDDDRPPSDPPAPPRPDRANIHLGNYSFGGWYADETAFRAAANAAFEQAAAEDKVKFKPFVVTVNVWRGKSFFSATAEVVG